MTTQGKLKVAGLGPLADYETVKLRLEVTNEAVHVERLRGNAPFGGIRDIQSAVLRAKIGGVLNPSELIDITTTLFSTRRLKRFLIGVDLDFSIPLIKHLASELTEHKPVEDEIHRCIDDQGVVMDSASAELSRIRSTLRTDETRVKEKLEQMIRSTANQKMLQDQVITIRNNRYVIPIKQEYRNHFGGLIHDQSASGATLFIEPESILQLNNKIRESKLKEEVEIEKILMKLTACITEIADLLVSDIELLAELDFIFAKAGLAKGMKASFPMMNNQGWIKIKRARHPLIPEDVVVPLDLELGDSYTAIIVTGPNTGGKTVTLKTVGILCIMAMSGLFIPAEDGSHLCIFDAIFADIGDEQSIEQNLSTFSSHMTNIISILEDMTAHSLVLLDELGAGTDPSEGSALAIAILDYIHQRGCRMIATTHYSELKAYAFQTPSTINASMEFDVQKLSPTYRLLVGVPGRSNAFAIASRLGLSDLIIEHARGQVDDEKLRVEVMIASIEENRFITEKQRMQAEHHLVGIQVMQLELEKQKKEFETQKDKLLTKAKSEAKEMVIQARHEADVIISDLRRMAMEEAEGIKEHRLIDARRRLDQIEHQWLDKPKTIRQHSKKVTFHAGDAVKVISLNQKGHIVEIMNPLAALVQLGVMKIKVSLNDVESIQEPKESKHIGKTAASVKRTRDETLRTEIDIRGLNVEEALLETDRFLDESFLANLNQVIVIHGKGTGVLRIGIQDYLRRNKHVKSYRTGTYSEGGQGVTIVEINR